ncbi:MULTISPECIES: DUF983 domain-containing protein [Oceanibaculum]|uniref:Uncharacterized protein (DUF983 family) n=1 Tax=Oceanibaculum indicum TaxID=526216 RepID=A0A420WGB4_9PROT|nr:MULTISPECIES: DUF983 domain-containing protein [Oceanibaculum]MCH2396390.1 DUF983 domain-containing protein [Oceanibaculum sp.]RKQ70027.1 uncharacterized protein (DUF983 family) [Oceanibaculum indicum]
MNDSPSYPPLSPVLTGLACRCPRCGRGRLFSGLLQVAERCEVCGLDLSNHDSGDGPAVFVIFALGIIVVPLALWVETVFQPPLWLHAVLWSLVILAGALGLLRLFKGVLVALQYKHRGTAHD